MLERFTERGHEELLVLHDAAAGLRGVIAVHDSRVGPALGATRVHPAASLDAALDEALRLSEAVGREAAMAGLVRGGAAAVFVGPAAAEKSRPFLTAYARLLDRLEGRVLAMADMGFDSRDLTVLARMTRHVAHRRGPGTDVAELTAQGVLEGIRAAALHLESPLDEMHVAIQGVGQVGYRLARLLAAEGARLTVADVDPGRVERVRDELGAEVVAAQAIAAVDADVFSPNAGSALLDEPAIDGLRGRAVVGSARAVLADVRDAETLHARGVLYAPDFVVCAGGLAGLAGDEDEMAVQERVAEVGVRLQEVWARSRAEQVSALQAAEAMLKARGTP
jgi:leucine dehydrogenase